MTEKEMIEIKHGSENMCDLLNQEQAELKKAMIEEMAKVMYGYICKDRPCEKCNYNQGSKILEPYCNRYIDARTLYEAGYRKIPEGAVVLTKEEWEKYQITQMDWNAIYYEGIEKARKETAREILDLLYSRMPKTQIVVEIEKRYGVKITD